MADLSLVAGTTSKTVNIFIKNSSVTTGAGLTGLIYNTASLTAYYIREGDTSTTAISLVAASVGVWTSGGFIPVDATHMSGEYQIGIPNAALAAGAGWVTIFLQGAANMSPYQVNIELTAVNNQSATAFMTSVASVGAVSGNVTGNVTGNVGGNITGNLTGVQSSYPKKNASLSAYPFPMYNTDGSAYTGAASAIVGYVSLNGATFAPLTNNGSAAAVSGVSGEFSINFAAADTNGTTARYVFTAPGCQQTKATQIYQG